MSPDGTPSTPPNVGGLIRQLRHERQWSQQQLTDATGLHLQTVSAIERGIQNPTAETIDSIAAAFGVTPSQLDSKRLGEVVAREARTIEQRAAVELALTLPPADLKALMDALRERQERRVKRGGGRR